MIRRAGGAALLAVLTLGGCSGGEPAAAPTSTAPTTRSAAPVPASEPPRPRNDRCYQLTYEQAIAPTTSSRPVSCRSTHTARTFHVGTFDAVVDGHLLAVDSARVQDQIATDCTRRLDRHLGGSADDVAVSMFRVVWFSPTLAQSDAGADWFRCDVIALAREDELARLPRDAQGALDAQDGLDRWGTCGAAEPGTDGFERVICSARHSWRAIAVVRHDGTRYPGARALTADRESCEDPARAAADDPLKVVFSYLAPTREQWSAGQHHGTCWVPTD